MSLIDPSKLPGDGLDADAVATHARALSGFATSIGEGGAATLRAWQALPTSYQSDGSEHLYDVMTPVGTASTDVGDGLAAVSRALAAYADTVRPIQADLVALKAEAAAFVKKVGDFKPHDVTTDDIWVKVSAGPMGFIDPPKTHIDSWDQDQGLVDTNNSLIRRGADLAEKWLEAQRTCADAILAAAGHSVAASSGQATPDQIMAQAEAMMPGAGDKDIQTPWGSTSSRKESCGEKAMGFPAHFVGGVFEGAFGMVKGVGSLLTGCDGTGVPWESELIAGWITGRSDLASDAWSRAGKGYAGAWLGMAHLGVSLVPGVDSALLTLGQTPLGGFLGKDVQQGLTDWAHDDQTALLDTVGGLVGLKLPDQWWDAESWDGFNIAQAWVDDPGGAAGSSAFNIASFFVPGAGEASAGAHAAEAAGSVTKVGDLLDAAGHAGAYTGDLAHGLSAAELASVADKVALTDAAHGLGDLHLGSLDASVAHESVGLDAALAKLDTAGAADAAGATDAAGTARGVSSGADLPGVLAHDAPLTGHDLIDGVFTNTEAPADIVPQAAHAESAGTSAADHAAVPERQLVSVGAASEHAVVGEHGAVGDHAVSPGDVTRGPSAELGRPGEAGGLNSGVSHADLGHGGASSAGEHAMHPGESAGDAASGFGRGESGGTHEGGAHGPAEGPALEPPPAQEPSEPAPAHEPPDDTPTAPAEPGHDTGSHEPPAHNPEYIEAAHRLAERTHTKVVELDSGTKSAWNSDLYHSAVQPETTYSVDGGRYLFQTDEHARVVHAEGHLDTIVDAADRVRHGGQQRIAGGEYRLSTDDGGHFFGTVFGGPGEGINLTAQLRGVNRGSFRALEQDWMKILAEPGGRVHVAIDAHYGSGLRPEGYMVNHRVPGDVEWTKDYFSNSPQP